MDLPTFLTGVGNDPLVRSSLFAALMVGVWMLIDKRIKGDDTWRKHMKAELEECFEREQRLRAEIDELKGVGR